MTRFLDGEPFAVLHRPGATGPDVLELLRGSVCEPASLAEVPLPTTGPDRHQALVVVPYRQLTERGFACHDDGAPLLCLGIEEQATIAVRSFLAEVPDTHVDVETLGFDIDDEEYAEIVRTVLRDEIGEGLGANFVIKRSFLGRLPGHHVGAALSLFRRLLTTERGAHWTFLIHTGERTIVGASPERHVTLDNGVATMNPISGTYRYPAGGPTAEGLLAFLGDRKEIEELHMVVDEELKMMAGVCEGDLRVEGPSLKAMRSLAHTEYLIHGRTSLGPREILRRTLFAPTVTGSPLESACRVLRSHERGGRGYYSGVAALIGTDHTGQSTMDSSILIRTAEIDAAGNLNAGFGATLVRHSDPDAEVAETHAKAAGLIAALCGTGQTAPAPVLPQDTAILDALAARNVRLAAFWLGGEDGDSFAPEFDGLTVLVVDHEDTFTAMLTHQLRALGLRVTVADWRETVAADAFDLVVLGPGPGDPRVGTDPKIRSIQDRVGLLLRESIPFVAVCLSHQVLSAALGLPLHRRPEPNQGTRCEIDFFGTPRLVGFYNTFISRSDHDRLVSRVRPEPVRVSRAAGTGDVHALSGHGFASVQFHPESLLTEHGIGIIRELLTSVLWPGTRRTPSRLARTSR